MIMTRQQNPAIIKLLRENLFTSAVRIRKTLELRISTKTIRNKMKEEQ